jgi:hypothetical protein
MGRRLDGPHSRFGRDGEEEKSQPLPILETPIIQFVAQRYTTELSRLLFKGKANVKVKMSPYSTKHHAMKTNGGVEL